MAERKTMHRDGDLWDRQAALRSSHPGLEKCHVCDRPLVDPIEIETNTNNGYEIRPYCSTECVARDVHRGVADE